MWDRGTFGGSVEAGSAVPPIVEDVELTPRPAQARLQPVEADELAQDGDASVQAATTESGITYGIGATMVGLSVDDQTPYTPSSASHEAASSSLAAVRQSNSRFAVE